MTDQEKQELLDVSWLKHKRWVLEQAPALKICIDPNRESTIKGELFECILREFYENGFIDGVNATLSGEAK